MVDGNCVLVGLVIMMLTAKEARQKVEDSIPKNIEKWKNVVERKINEAATEGLYFTSVTLRLQEKERSVLENHLKELGYGVQEDSLIIVTPYGAHVTILWGDNGDNN